MKKYISVTDNIENNLTSREFTDEGFLKVPAHVSRTGIQQYLASELSLDGDPNRIVNVLRPKNEVFDKDSLDSFNAIDMTNDHPNGLVNSKNYKSVSVGTVKGSGVQDGDMVKCNLIVKDENAIKSIKNGKNNLSVGYTALYDNNVPADADYEFIQSQIRANHIALTSQPRAGNKAKIFDNKPNQERGNSMKITLDSGKEIAIEDEKLAILVNDSISNLQKINTSLAEEKEKLAIELEKSKASFDAIEKKLEEVKKLSSDEAINEKIKLVNSTILEAKKINSEISFDTTDILEIKKTTLKSVNDKIDWDKKSTEYLEAYFDIYSQDSESLTDSKVKKQYTKLSTDMSKTTKIVDQAKKYKDSISEAYKKTIKL